jgi:hypothetical protein
VKYVFHGLNAEEGGVLTICESSRHKLDIHERKYLRSVYLYCLLDL